MQKNRKAKIIGIIKENIKQNYKEYLISLIFFVGGIFLGVFFINQTAEMTDTHILYRFSRHLYMHFPLRCLW